MEVRWFFIFLAIAFGSMFLAMGYSMAEKSKARAQVAIACYNAGQKDCAKWTTE